MHRHPLSLLKPNFMFNKKKIELKKRYMYSCTSTACNAAKNAFARSFATWANVTREAISSTDVPIDKLETHPSGYKILCFFDHSGHPHKILVDKSDNSIPGFYKAYGIWTTSKFAIKGTKLVDTGGFAIDQQSKEKQYFLMFERPTIVNIECVEEDSISTMFIHSQEYQQFIEELKIKFGIT